MKPVINKYLNRAKEKNSGNLRLRAGFCNGENRIDIRNLKKRYLIWLYKTSKEALDKIERRFTQLDIDKYIFKELKKTDKIKGLRKFIDEFRQYIKKKKKDGLNLKYKNGKLRPDYLFLVFKLAAIEKAIVKELGQKALFEIKSLYEKEMTNRILKSTENT